MKNIGLEQLRKLKEETTERWRKLGLLEGVVDGNIAGQYQGKLVCEVYKENNCDVNSYFIPEISDFRFGYEFEKNYASSGDDWYPTKIVTYLDFEGLEFYIGEGLLRTPYLTKEQIEAEGWIETVSHGVFGKKENKVGYLQCVGEPPLIWIAINDQEKYHGECKSINEFHYICKLLKIK